MTCAHIVNVALSKLPGVASAEVSLNNALATVKMKPNNKLSVPQLWRLLREKGYTPKDTAVLVRGELAGPPERLQLKVTGTSDVIPLTGAVAARVGQTVVVQGVMIPGKDLKAPVPLQVSEVK